MNGRGRNLTEVTVLDNHSSDNGNTAKPGAMTSAGNEDATNLIINYLPQTLTDDEFKSMFVSVGAVKSCKIIRDKTTNYSYGFGFVDYESHDDALKAISSLNGMQLQNKRIKVAFSRTHDKVKGANLYMKNIPRDYGTPELEALCRRFGSIVNVRILTDHNSKSKGVGFVLYDSCDQAKHAQSQLDGLIPDGYTEALNVKFAEDSNNKGRGQVGAGHGMQQPYRSQVPWAGGGYGRGMGNQLGGMGYGMTHQQQYGGPTRNQGRYNQRYNPFSSGNAMQGGGMQSPMQGNSIPSLAGGDHEGHVLFVYNIGTDTDEGTLWQLFAQFGCVAKANVIRDAAKGVGKGYGFVTMPNIMEAQSAVQSLNGYRFYGKPLQVSFKNNRNG